VKLFVYGLLRPGFEGAELLGDARTLGAATTRGWLYELGGYPGLIAGEGTVHGIVCDVYAARLPAIDEFEGYDPRDPAGSLYLRETLTAWCVDTGKAVIAQAYRYNRQAPPAGWIPGGDYCRHSLA